MNRVLHVTRDFPPPGNGGLSTAVAGMVRASVAAGVSCAVVSFDAYRPRSSGLPAETVPAENGAVDGIPVIRVRSPNQLEQATQFGVDFEPTLIHVHHGMLWDFAADLAGRVGAATVKTVHVAQSVQDRLREVDRETLSTRAQLAALAAAGRVVAPSRALAEHLVAENPGLAARLRVVGLGIADEPVARAAVSAPGGRAAGPVLFVGRLSDIKGVDEFLAAVPLVLSACPGTRFVLAGGLPENRKAERRRIRRFTESAETDTLAAVSFAGWLGREELHAQLAGCRVLVVPSWFETFGQVALEGMLFGCPIVATAAGALVGLLEHRRTALLSAPREAEALAVHVLELLQRPELARSLGAAAAEQARSAHSWSARTKDLLEVYRELR